MFIQNNSNIEIESEKIQDKEIIVQENQNDVIEEKIASEEMDTIVEDVGEWYIEISSINLKAPIQETTNMDILNISVGHFEETSSREGNIGLAAHNRGYQNNYFENLKNVKLGDEIKYKNYDFEKVYIVDKIEIVKETDWSYLENTEQNRITLITCIEDKPEDRLCVQAIEK